VIQEGVPSSIIYNAFVLHKSLHPEIKFLKFRLQIVRDILEKYGSGKEYQRNLIVMDHPLRLSGKHFLSYNPPTKRKIHGSRECKVCSGTHDRLKRTRRETVYQCATCNY
jgi:hypothetical protein